MNLLSVFTYLAFFATADKCICVSESCRGLITRIKENEPSRQMDTAESTAHLFLLGPQSAISITSSHTWEHSGFNQAQWVAVTTEHAVSHSRKCGLYILGNSKDLSRVILTGWYFKTDFFFFETGTQSGLNWLCTVGSPWTPGSCVSSFPAWGYGYASPHSVYAVKGVQPSPSLVGKHFTNWAISPSPS